MREPEPATGCFATFVALPVFQGCLAFQPETWSTISKSVKGVLVVLLVSALYFELVMVAGPTGPLKELDLVSLVASLPNLTLLNAALNRTALQNLFLGGGANVTLFAPTDFAFHEVFEKSLLTCVHDFYQASPCTSDADLLTATNLEAIVLNHFVNGMFHTENLTDGQLLQSLGDIVIQVTDLQSGLYIGDAKVVDYFLASHAVIHVINGSVLGSINQITGLSSDVSFNSSAVLAASKLGDFDIFDDNKRGKMAEDVQSINIPIYQYHRGLVGLPDGGMKNPSVLSFDPSLNTKAFASPDLKFKYPSTYGVKRPASDEDLAFMTVSELAYLVKNRKVTSAELVKVFTERLLRYDATLQVVITYTTELAQEQADEADALIKRGKYQGPLHGIPYGLKDTIAVPDYKTTWGSTSFKDQVIDEEAWVYKKLKAAGAVLIAKLACGSLASGDIWFGGRTRNPWNIAEFTLGSSSGSAAATSAALVPFAIGSETSGSIVYPASRTGVTAFRPTFGMVGRSGTMSLSESLDKLGPFCRSASDCAIILDVLRGKDPEDFSSKDIKLKDPFGIDVSKLTVGYLADADVELLNILAAKRVKLVPFQLAYSVDSAPALLGLIMEADMLSHFDHWQRAGLDDEYEDQADWPVAARRARMISAVDYIHAQRVRGLLSQEVLASISEFDAIIGNATDREKIAVTNLVGLPVLVLPTGMEISRDAPRGDSQARTIISAGIYGAPFKDGEVLALGIAYQSVTGHHLLHPPIDDFVSHPISPNYSVM